MLKEDGRDNEQGAEDYTEDSHDLEDVYQHLSALLPPLCDRVVIVQPT